MQPLHRILVEGEYIQLPELVNVPMMQIGTADFIVKMPFKAGDIVPVVIADFDISNLVLTGENRDPNVDEFHEINDAIALPVVLNSFNNELPNNDPEDLTVQKRNGLSKIVIKAETEEIVIESNIIRLGENATQGVKLADDSNSTKVLAE